MIQAIGINYIVGHYVEGTLFFCFITSGLIMFFSFISGAITKLISRAWRKWSAEMDAQILAAEAQSAQESAELEQAISENSKEE